MAEGFDLGPGGLLPNPGWRFVMDVPEGKYLALEFAFHAAWENMIWICNANTGEKLQDRGNYFRSTEPWYSDIGKASRIGLVAYHKTVSPDASDAGSHPWLQSPMAVKQRNGDETVIGFTDGGPNFEQAICTIRVVGNR